MLRPATNLRIVLFPDKKSLCRVAGIAKLFPDGPALPGERHSGKISTVISVAVRSSCRGEWSKRFFGCFNVRRIGFCRGFKTPEVGLFASHSDFSDVLTLSGHPDAFNAELALNAP